MCTIYARKCKSAIAAAAAAALNGRATILPRVVNNAPATAPVHLSVRSQLGHSWRRSKVNGSPFESPSIQFRSAPIRVARRSDRIRFNSVRFGPVWFGSDQTSTIGCKRARAHSLNDRAIIERAASRIKRSSEARARVKAAARTCARAHEPTLWGWKPDELKGLAGACSIGMGLLKRR